MRLTDLMVLVSLQGSMLSDAALNPRPMTHYVESNADIRSLFNYVSYAKSGTVLRMMMLALGQNTFYKGLQYYLEDMAYKNAVAEDLYAGLQKAADEAKVLPTGLTIEAIMNSWTLVGGFPVVNVNRDSNILTLTQTRFVLTNANPGASKFYIPITYTTDVSPSFDPPTAQAWFYGNSDKLEVEIPEAASWYILNKQQASYQRVNYDEANWKSLAAELTTGDFNKIHLLNRAQLLDDSFDLAQYDRLNVTVALEIFSYMAEETDYVPWAAVESGFSRLYTRIVLSDHADIFTVKLNVIYNN